MWSVAWFYPTSKLDEKTRYLDFVAHVSGSHGSVLRSKSPTANSEHGRTFLWVFPSTCVSLLSDPNKKDKFIFLLIHLVHKPSSLSVTSMNV